MSIEAPPLALTEDQEERLLNWSYGMEPIINRSTALAIALNVGRNTLLRGESRTSHREYQRRCGVCRRSVDSAVKLLKRHGIIERIGTAQEGHAIYRANLGEPKDRANDVA
ncbi:hypothetical protein [Mesorhizobium sp. f-mel]